MYDFLRSFVNDTPSAKYKFFSVFMKETPGGKTEKSVLHTGKQLELPLLYNVP